MMTYSKTSFIILLWFLCFAAVGCFTGTQNEYWTEATDIKTLKDGRYLFIVHDEYKDWYELVLSNRDSQIVAKANYKKAIVAPTIDTINGKWITLQFDDSIIGQNCYQKEFFYDTILYKAITYPDYFFEIDTFKIIYKYPCSSREFI